MATNIAALVGGHWLCGELPLSGVRIQDVLNDSNTDLIELQDVEVHYSLTKRECVASLPSTVIPKEKLQLVLVFSSNHEAPDKRWNCHAKRAVHSVFAIAGNLILTGEVHLQTPTSDARFVYMNEFRRFFALTSVMLSGQGTETLGVPLVFVSKEMVSCLQITGPETSLEAQSEEPNEEEAESDQFDRILGNVRELLCELQTPPSESENETRASCPQSSSE